MLLKKRTNYCVSIVLTIVILITGIMPINTKAAESENTVLPFKLENTDRGIKDADIIAKKLVLTSDNASIVKTGLTDFVVVKEIIDNVEAKIYLVGSQGVLHTFIVDADDPWLDKLESEYSTYPHFFERQSVFIRIHCWYGYNRDVFDSYGFYDNAYEDVLFSVLNPEGKYDLLNISSGKYYSYNYDELCNDNSLTMKNFIEYKQNGKIGLLNTKGETLCKAEFDNVYNFLSENVLLLSYFENKEEIYSLVSDNGIFDGTEKYADWEFSSINDNWSRWFYGKSLEYSEMDREENTGVVVQDFEDNYIYVDLTTGEKTILHTGKNLYDVDIVGRMKNNVVAYENRLVKDKATGENEYKAYLISGTKHIDLNDKLGGDYCSISTLGRGTDGLVNEYMFVRAYSNVRDNTGGWTKEYYYQGVIDSNGEKIYGNTLPEYWEDVVYDFKGDYGIIFPYEESDSIRGHNAEKAYVVQRGKQNHIYNFESDYSYDEKNRVDEDRFRIVNQIGDYLELYSRNSRKDILDLKKGKIISLDSVSLNSELNINGEQYAFSHKVIQNLETDEKFEENEGMTVKAVIKENSDNKDKRALFLIYCNNNAYTVLNEKLKPVNHGTGSVIYISEDMNIVTSNGIYNYDGECILAANIRNSNEVERNEKGEGLLPVYYNDSDNWIINNSKYTFCDIKGNLLNDYKYEIISQFRNGIACIGYESSPDYGSNFALIDASGKTLVEFDYISYTVCDYEESGPHICDNLEVNGKEFAIYNSSSAYIYDLSKAANRTGSFEDASYNEKEEQDYNELLEWAEEIDDIKLSGMTSTFRVPDEVPVIGGQDFDFDFSTIPVVAEKSGNTFRIGIGIEMKEGKLFSLKPTAWENFKKNVESMNKDLIDGNEYYKRADKFGKLSTALKSDVKGSFYGYLEGTISKGRTQSVQGKGVFEIGFSVKKKWQKVVAGVPLVLKIEGGSSVENTATIGFDYSNKTIYTDGTLEMELPEIKVAGGIGVISVADATAYGSIKNILSIDKYHIQDYVKGDMGISLNFLFYSTEKSLWPFKRKVIYDSSGGIVTASMKKLSLLGKEEDYVIDRQNPDNISDWKTDIEETGMANSMILLQENSYTHSNPQIAALDNGTLIMVYTTDLKERETGNHTAVVYSLYDKEKGEWQSPNVIENDGTADYYPTLATEGNVAYVAWVDSNSDRFSSDSTMKDIASSCEIKVAKFDTDSETFAEPQLLSNNNFADIMPSLTIKDGEVHVTWMSNSENDMINLSGNNSIYYGCCKNGIWTVREILSQPLPVAKAKIGNLNGKLSVAFLTDKDGDIETVDDIEISILDVSSSENIYSNQANGISEIKFAPLGSDDVLFVTGQNGLEYTKDATAYTMLLSAEDNENMQYDIVSRGDSTLIFACRALENNSDIVCYEYDNGMVSSPVPITRQDNYINHVSGVSAGKDIYLTFKRDKTEFNNDSFEINSDLCMMEFSDYTDMELEELSVNKDEIVPGKDISLNVECKNVGIQDVNSYMVEVKAGEEIISTYTEEKLLKKGQSNIHTISCNVPEDITKDSQLSVSIICEDDKNQDNNSKNMPMGHPDLKLSVHRFGIGQQPFAEIYVENETAYEANGVQIVVRKLNSEGDVFKSFDIGNVINGKRQKVSLTLDDIKELGNTENSLYIEVVSESEEVYYTNNYGFLSLDEINEYKINLDTDELYFDSIGQKQTIQYTVFPEEISDDVVFDSSDLDVVDVSDDGTVTAVGDGSATVYLTLKGNEEVNASVYCIVNTESYEDDKPVTGNDNLQIPSPGITKDQNLDTNSKTYNSIKDVVVQKPGKVMNLRITNKKNRKMLIRWKWKVSVSGFQVQYAQNRRFTKKKKTKIVGSIISKKTIKNLKKGKTYYVRVRAYRKASGNKVYGKWSKVKKIKIKK